MSKAIVSKPAPTAVLDVPWQIAFQPDRGAPAAIALDQLIRLNEHADAGVRHFSGMATYMHALSAPASCESGTEAAH